MSKPMATVTGWYGGYPVIEPIDGWIPAAGTVLYSAPEPEPKPVVWIRHENEWVGLAPKERLPINTPRPDARKPLTDEQIDAEFDRECWVSVVFADGTRGIALDKVTAKDFARAIERAHGIGSE